MTNEKLYEVLGDINEKHINEARAYHKAKKPGWVKWGAMAACLCLIVAGVTVISQHDFSKPDAGSGYGDEGQYSVAVFPASENIKDVASAEVVSLTENEALNNALAEHLPVKLPEDFHYGRGSVYNTVMKDGTQYNMLRIEYISGTITEQQFAEDGGAIDPDLETMGDFFTICVMNYEPETDISIYSPNEEVTQSILEENGAVYIRSGNCYVGVFVETAKPEAVLEALRSIVADK